MEQNLSEIVTDLIKVTLNKNDFIKKELSILKDYDIYTYYHSLNVAVESAYTGFQMGLNDELMEQLIEAALLHDIGKKYIDINILNKKGKLTSEEFEIIKNHPKWGAQEIKQSGYFSDDVVNGILYHHENFDGSGYYGLKGEEIPLLAKLVRITDTFDAMTDKRPYHDQKNEADVLKEMANLVEKNFCPKILCQFLSEIQKGKPKY